MAKRRVLFSVLTPPVRTKPLAQARLAIHYTTWPRAYAYVRQFNKDIRVEINSEVIREACRELLNG